MILKRFLPCAAAVVILAGCSSTAPQYYSLQSVPTNPAGTPGKIESAYAISVQPVVIPQQIARPQIVVSTTPNAEVVPLSAALWAGPLESQIRNTLADALSRRLNVMDVGQSGAAEGLPVWRIYVDVQRFDSIYGEAVQQEIVWRMVPQGMPKTTKERVCSATVRLPVGTGMSALVQGHRDALEKLSAVIAQEIPQRGNAPAGQPTTSSSGVHFRGCVG